MVHVIYDLDLDVRGSYSRKMKLIRIRPNQGFAREFSVLFHEVVHHLLHVCRFPTIFHVFNDYSALGLYFSFFQVYRKVRRAVFLSRVVDAEVEKLRQEFPHDERGVFVTEKDFDRVSRKIEKIICLQKELCRLNSEVKNLEARNKKVS